MQMSTQIKYSDKDTNEAATFIHIQ